MSDLNGQEMALYSREGDTFVREMGEFNEKFKHKPNQCVVCGATENLHYEGQWYGYRCDSDGCMVI